MTWLSKMAVPPSITRQGILPSGLALLICDVVAGIGVDGDELDLVLHALHGHGDLHLAAIGRQRIGQQLHHGGASGESLRRLRPRVPRWCRAHARGQQKRPTASGGCERDEGADPRIRRPYSPRSPECSPAEPQRVGSRARTLAPRARDARTEFRRLGKSCARPTRGLDFRQCRRTRGVSTSTRRKQGEPHGVWILAVPTLGSPWRCRLSGQSAPVPAAHRPSTNAAARERAKGQLSGSEVRRRIFAAGVPRETRSPALRRDRRRAALSRRPRASGNPPAIAAACPRP